MTTSDGLACTNEKNNTMYMTALELSGLLKVNANVSENIELVTFNNEEMMWPGLCTWKLINNLRHNRL